MIPAPRPRPVGEDDLVAFADGRLDPARRQAVDEHLAARPEDAAAAQADREAGAALRSALAGKAGEPIPARLRIAAIAAERRRRRAHRLTAAAVALVWVGSGAVGGWLANDLVQSQRTPSGPTGVVGEALAAHRTFTVETVHPVEVKADQEAHLAQWLSKRLGRRLVIPDLDGVGLHLVGGRLLPAGREVAAQLMYAGPNGNRVTLYLRSGESGTASPQVLQQSELASAYWSEAGFGYALSGALGRDRLLSIARAVNGGADDALPRAPRL